jgi:GntR family transcriptional regulator / MocR family aminotransferase
VAWLKNGIDDQAAHFALFSVGIETLPLSVYCIKPLGRSGIVLGFSGTHERRIPNLVKRMSEALRSLASVR